jgi:glycine cleavage system aminomethyltransferase T
MPVVRVYGKITAPKEIRRMSPKSLEDAIQMAGNPVNLLRNSQLGPYVYPVVPPEFTNWRDEQVAWQQTCALFNQSFHMTDMTIEGPDALRLLQDFGINSFKNFGVDKAKQYVACSPDGYVIGDVILFYLAESLFNIVGRPSVHNWLQYQCEKGKYNAKLERDERSVVRQGPPVRKNYRFQIQGPLAPKLMEKLTGKPTPDIKFFNMGAFTIAGRSVRALRHGMVGQPGWEMFGPWEEGDSVRNAIIEAGKEFGLRQVGSRAYSSNTLESGWIPSPIPAVYTGEQLKPYRQWLPGNGYEATASLGGSFYSDNITDYYFTPYDLGYGSIVKFDHDFCGREALEKMPNKERRQKVTLVWDGDDATRAIGSLFQKSPAAKYIDFPSAVYATLPYDKVSKGARTIGVSTWSGYSFNERSMLSLAVIDAEHSQPGTEVTLVWGEEGGGSMRPTVERHVQTEIRVTVAPVPYGEVARTAYRPK